MTENEKGILLTKAVNIVEIMLTGQKTVTKQMIWHKAGQIASMDDFIELPVDIIAAACSRMERCDSFEGMLQQSIVEPRTKGLPKPRKHKRHRKPDVLDRLSAMLERKEATGYSWQEDEMPDKDW